MIYGRVMDVFAGHRAVTRRLAAPCIAIGNFDGVHLGHRALLDAAKRRAAEHGGAAIALTFDPHPTAVIAPHLAPPLITSRARKLELLAEAGMDATVVEPFTTELAALPAADFVDRVLVGALGVRHVVVGWDFTYGKGRGGTTSTLEAHGARAGFGVDVIDKVTVGGDPASSTRVRGYLRGGDLAAARRLLGRDYDLDGTVVRGAQRGRVLGFPTANLAPDVEPLLAPGIYAGIARVGDRDVAAAISLGTNPTFVDGGGLVLEAHLLDWDGDLYDQRLRLRFVQKIRDEARFDSAEALIARIHADIDEIRAALRAFLV
jgi:riboflavin kinase/FMN adenylyltransferase